MRITWNYTKSKKSKKWTEKEEVALAKTYTDASEDKEHDKQQRSKAFLERVLAHFKD